MKGPSSTTLERHQNLYVRHGHAFIKVGAGQSAASVLTLMGRNGTLWCCPRCWSQTACPLCFIRSSKIHWPGSIAQKGSISKPCPLRLGPGPLSVGKVSVAFVQVHRTQTAARQGQAADLYSRLRQSMAAPAQTQSWFEQQPCVYTVKGFLLLVCSHYLGNHWTHQAYRFHLGESTKEGFERKKNKKDLFYCAFWIGGRKSYIYPI